MLPYGTLHSLYSRRVVKLAQEALESPSPDELEVTLRKCIAFCYNVTTEWAPFVRVTVFADNPSEHQSNIEVLGALLRAWGVPGFEGLEVQCRPIHGTDVRGGRVVANPFWSRIVKVGEQEVSCREVAHQLLHWFVSLSDSSPRKQLLVNILLQLHEACFNCIGRHKEVFEYCIYDLIDAETAEGVIESVPADSTASCGSGSVDQGRAPHAEDRARSIVRHHAAWFLDRHKRAALHAVTISPLKFLYQHRYEVFENLDSHGSSFWASMLTDVFFPGLEMPFEPIVDLDTGWSWGAVHFLPVMATGDGHTALERFCSLEGLGRDWRSLAAGLQPPDAPLRRLPGLHYCSFEEALSEARRPRSQLRRTLEPYAVRFAGLMERRILLWRCGLAAVGSERWDAELGPALVILAEEVLREHLTPQELRERLCGDCADAAAISPDSDLLASLLRAAGVPWA